MFKKIMVFGLTVITCWSCEKDKSTATGFQLHTPFALQFAETNQSTEDNITVNFFEVLSDSRCPSEVECFWEGESSVKINFSIDGSNTPLTLSTHKQMGQGPQTDTLQNYIIRLLEVSPYPVGTEQIPNEDYEIRLQIDEL
ncbi:MAG: hypothetical protein KTR30_20365 [Saprospiraceae bacterium]|nr:hypothetical protein [Saprospiraceae bacterium]